MTHAGTLITWILMQAQHASGCAEFTTSAIPPLQPGNNRSGPGRQVTNIRALQPPKCHPSKCCRPCCCSWCYHRRTHRLSKTQPHDRKPLCGPRRRTQETGCCRCAAMPARTTWRSARRRCARWQPRGAALARGARALPARTPRRLLAKRLPCRATTSQRTRAAATARRQTRGRA